MCKNLQEYEGDDTGLKTKSDIIDMLRSYYNDHRLNEEAECIILDFLEQMGVNIEGEL